MILWFELMLVIGMLLSLSSPFMASMALAGASLLVGVGMAQMKFSWMFFTITILFVGGMMVLFMYICSLTANLKSESNSSLMLGGIVLLFLLWGAMTSNFSVLNYNSFNSLSSLYQASNQTIILFLVIYLLIGLIAAVQIVNKFEGPLKSKLTDVY